MDAWTEYDDEDEDEEEEEEEEEEDIETESKDEVVEEKREDVDAETEMIDELDLWAGFTKEFEARRRKDLTIKAEEKRQLRQLIRVT